MYQPIQPLNSELHAEALAYQDQLTKPPGSLGRLEQLGALFAAAQEQLKPSLDKVSIRVFAADHGVAEEGVSAFPQEVTTEMVRNFSRGGAAITVLARQLNADFKVVNAGTLTELEPLPQVEDARVAAGSANFCRESAMTPLQLQAALELGRQAAAEAAEQGTHLFIGGEMGIANTTAATALAAALLQQPAQSLVGPGTGIDRAGIDRKAAVIDRALALHQPQLDSPLAILQHLGGLEIAALCGAYLGCAQRGLPVLVDGFITTSAALVAVRINPDLRPWLLFSHNSAEPGHRLMQQAMAAEPLLDLGMRLGEGSGAAVCVPLLQSACRLQSEMATFAEASVSENLI
ncbi:nicotinate-nucleotide--dimethylbenzimidazole phosphoribosyltransferase [Motiliproteus coralliicola]|uniref:Nicotinate-nucleotide--dimethylbenzimidazole phosphoribosyltransferase n=1 Tax=Motiliproteus coralliicola TaxID=2283196 RepID=A0A369WNH0_9GAMM|nr:nicotinate-nucleotide--dimethylbenzimidazole phosphoribosyltransferase [Motiliproteus coralliicola]